MKNLLMAFLMNRDKNTESMKPMIISTLARAVFFPDGQTLLEKWENDIKTSINIAHTTENTELNGSTFKWSCTTYGDSKYQLSTHFRPSIANEPTQLGTNTDTQSSITLTKIDENGVASVENIPYGTNASINQYRFVIPLPSKFIEERTVNFNNASINITEGHESDFLTFNTFHNIYTEYANGNLFIYINHYNGMDAVDMSNLIYVTGDFNIIIDGLFI